MRLFRLPFLFVLLLLTALLGSNNTASAQLQKTVAMLKGDVVGQDGEKVSGVSIAIYNGTDKLTTTRSTNEGKFSAILQPGNTYRVTFTHPSFLFDEETITAPASEKYLEIPLHASLKPLRDGQSFTITQPIFDQKSSTISQAAIPQLDAIVTVMKHNPKVSLAITVYPDQPIKSKKDAKQEQLTLGRSSAVTSYLLANGISETSFTITRSNTVPEGRFPTTVTTPATKKKKAKTTQVLIPQYIDIVAHLS